jgi:hypothetical protein
VPVISPAFAGRSDAHAWMIRGWVESGVPESLGGHEAVGGVFELGPRGELELRFASVPSDLPHVYAASRHVDAAGNAVWWVCCPETLFLGSFEEAPVEALGARVIAHVRHHDAAFAAWRGQGGAVSPTERAGVQAPRGGVPADPALLRVIAALRAGGAGLADGPAAGWWSGGVAGGPADRRALGAAITAGEGREPAYRLRVDATQSPGALAHAARIRTAGTALIVIGAAGVVLGGLALVAAVGVGLSMGWWRVAEQPGAVAAVVAGVPAGIAQVVAGWSMRSLKRPELARWLALLAGLPCAGACCFVGLPAGAWAFYVLRDPRTAVVCT